MNRAKHAEINHLTILDFYLDLFARGTYSISNRARLDSERCFRIQRQWDDDFNLSGSIAAWSKMRARWVFIILLIIFMVFYLFFELLNDLHLNAALCCWLVIERVVLVQVPKLKYYKSCLLIGWRLRSRSDLEVCIVRCLEILRVKNGWKRSQIFQMRPHLFLRIEKILVFLLVQH